MEKNPLPKEAPDQGHSRIEAILREVERSAAGKNAGVDTDLEDWRTERRQLKAEIERLQRTVDEKSQETSKGWENERTALAAEISRLQHAVGELIERSNNPKRAGISAREDLEAKLKAAIQAKDRAAAGFIQEKAAWEEEKSRINAELEQLRLIAQGKGLRGKLAIDSRIKDEGRIKELESRVAELQRELELARATARLQIQRLEKQAAESRPAVNVNIDLEGRITALKKELDLERASAKLQIQRLEKQVTESRPAANADNEIARVEKLIADITKKISDPATELSTVIRKNVELAELNAYLKGIQYSQGNARNR